MSDAFSVAKCPPQTIRPRKPRRRNTRASVIDASARFGVLDGDAEHRIPGHVRGAGARGDRLDVAPAAKRRDVVRDPLRSSAPVSAESE